MYKALTDIPQHLDQYYKDRQQNFEMLAKSFKGKASRLSLLRLFYFLVMAFVLIYLWSSIQTAVALVFTVLICSGFFVLVRRYQKMLSLQQFNQAMAKVNADEYAALHHACSLE